MCLEAVDALNFLLSQSVRINILVDLESLPITLPREAFFPGIKIIEAKNSEF